MLLPQRASRWGTPVGSGFMATKAWPCSATLCELSRDSSWPEDNGILPPQNRTLHSMGETHATPIKPAASRSPEKRSLIKTKAFYPHFIDTNIKVYKA